jgi:hypothetical protein
LQTNNPASASPFNYSLIVTFGPQPLRNPLTHPSAVTSTTPAACIAATACCHTPTHPATHAALSGSLVTVLLLLLPLLLLLFVALAAGEGAAAAGVAQVSGCVGMVCGEWRRAAPAPAAYSQASSTWLAHTSPVWQSVTCCDQTHRAVKQPGAVRHKTWTCARLNAAPPAAAALECCLQLCGCNTAPEGF